MGQLLKLLAAVASRNGAGLRCHVAPPSDVAVVSIESNFANGAIMMNDLNPALLSGVNVGRLRE